LLTDQRRYARNPAAERQRVDRLIDALIARTAQRGGLLESDLTQLQSLSTVRPEIDRDDLARAIRRWVRPSWRDLLHYPDLVAGFWPAAFIGVMIGVALAHRDDDDEELHAALVAALRDPERTPDRLSKAIRARGPTTVQMAAGNIVARVGFVRAPETPWWSAP
jgi:hypothetical protein